jgi:hypothetical protein
MIFFLYHAVHPGFHIQHELRKDFKGKEGGKWKFYGCTRVVQLNPLSNSDIGLVPNHIRGQES